MNHLAFKLNSFLRYLFIAKDEHALHSPLLFEWYMDCIKQIHPFYFFENIENIRKELLQNYTQLNIQDFGAGSKNGNQYSRSIASIAQQSLSSAKSMQLLSRMVFKYKPTTILELGTSLGLSSSYMASAHPETKVYTIEGSNDIAKIATQQFGKLRLKNIHSVIGNIDEELPNLLQKIKPDFVYMDANHRKAPTLQYFKQITEVCTEECIIILDDIYWSPEMKEAWDEVRQFPQVVFSIDLYDLGILFLRKNQTRQHFVLKF